MPEPRPNWIVAAAAVLLSATVATGLYLGVQTRAQFLEISESWAGFAVESDRKGELISRVRGLLGYGGIIHNFKNYVLRQEDIYRDRVRDQLSGFDEAVQEYLGLAVTDAEIAALGSLSATINEYRRNLDLAERGAQQGWPAERTDRLVRVDDHSAIVALSELERIWLERRLGDTKRLVSAVERGEGLIGIGFLSMALLVVASVALALAFWMLLRQMRQTMVYLAQELEARQKLARSEERLTQAVEQSPATIMITDTDGRIQYVNRHFERLSGWSRTEVVGQTPKFLQSGDTDAREYGHMQNLLGRGLVWRGVLRNLKKDGGSYWIESTILPLLGPNGSAHSFLGIGEDISERREAREQMARAQKIEAVGLLAGGIAHDFNSILTAILGSAHLAALDAPKNSEQEQEIEQIEIAARRAQILVRQLLDFARRKPGNPAPTDLCDVVRQTLRLLRAATPSTIRFEFDPAPGPDWVMGDPTQMHQILMNLCGNAAEAIGGNSGAVTVIVARASAPPETTGAVAENWVTLEVRDDGPGMPDDVRSRVFDAFYTTKPLGKGTGLGLAVVHGIVSDMKGIITVESEVGAGSCFRLLLPGATAPGAAKCAENLAPPHGAERLMIVDDEQEISATLRRSFNRLGYQVEAFTSPLVALRAFENGSGRFDAVITDVVMPDMDGIHLAKKLRQLSPDIPIMFLTGYSPRSLSLDGPKPAVVEKPVDPLTLARALRAHLDAR